MCQQHLMAYRITSNSKEAKVGLKSKKSIYNLPFFFYWFNLYFIYFLYRYINLIALGPTQIFKQFTKDYRDLTIEIFLDLIGLT